MGRVWLRCKKTKDRQGNWPDGVPVEVYKHCPRIKNELFQLISFMWDEEVVPANVVIAKFKMLYKNKGSRNDPSKYRCIALLNHAYKVLSLILLGRILQVSDGFLKDWQAGFRETRPLLVRSGVWCVPGGGTYFQTGGDPRR